MLINLRNALMTGKRLPYDAEVEYLRVDAVGPYIVIDGVTYCNAVGTYYAFTISSGGVVTHDLIPVRLGNTGYMYDRITNKRFGNAGTGDFVLGPDVVPVEYIESHGTEYIDTGIKGSQSLVTTLNYQLTAITRSRAIFGSYENNAKYYLYVSSGGSLQVGSGNAYVNTATTANALRHIAKFFANTVEIDGSTIATLAASAAETAQTLLLFSMHNNSGGVYDGEPCRIFGFKIETNSIPIRDYKAIRVGSGTTWEGAMMDTLTRRIYRNAGTGAFTYGNDLKYPIPAS